MIGMNEFATIPTMRMQVDGMYEDWMEVLRLIYHGGGSSGALRGAHTVKISENLSVTGSVTYCGY